MAASARTQAQTLRALLARCSAKCHRRAASPSYYYSSTASFSTLRGAAPAPSPSPYATAAAAAARAQTRSLAIGAAARGGGAAGPPGDADDDDAEEDEEREWAVEWEDSEDEGVEPEIGDGGDGGGVVLRDDVMWGQRALAAAEEVLAEHFFGDDLAMFAFKVSPKGYVYVRLDKLTARYGCPGVEEIERFNRLYKRELDEIIERGDIPLDLAIEVSSPGAERLLKVPEDLDRFKDMAMRVQYRVDDGDDDNNLVAKRNTLKDGIFSLESIDVQAEHCVWKLADVKENRAEAGKGRPLNRKQKDWRLRTPFGAVKKATLYLDSN